MTSTQGKTSEGHRQAVNHHGHRSGGTAGREDRRQCMDGVDLQVEEFL